MSVSIRGVSAHYVAGRDVLHNLSLEIPAGQVTTVLGASGSGKTTLLRVLAGLHSPSRGQVFVAGKDITNVPVERRRVGLVPQEGALFQHLTVAGNIAYGLRGVSRRRAACHPRVQEMLALVGLEGLEDRLPSQLSGGQQQRVALARALAPEPKLVLLDEPFSALDPSLRMRVRDEVFAILRQQNLPTLLITHDQQEALSCSDLVAVLRDGHLVQVGTPRELYSTPADEWVAGFVGDACILPAGVVGDRLGHLVVARPEQLQISRVEDLENVLPSGQVYATVQGTRYLGHSLLVDLLVDAPGGDSEPLRLTARMDGEHAVVPAGTKVCVSARRPLYQLS